MQLKSLVLFVTLLSTASTAATLPLAPGTYVLDGLPCADPPFAATFDYDGRQFSYPHATRCKSVIRSHVGPAFTVRETCSALGDGSPTAPTTITETYRIKSPTHVAIGRGHNQAAAYRRCPKS